MKIMEGDWETAGPCWVRIFDETGAPTKPVVICRCGNYFGLVRHHVHADGRVTESFFDPQCGFHEYLELGGYDGPEFLPEKRDT